MHEVRLHLPYLRPWKKLREMLAWAEAEFGAPRRWTTKNGFFELEEGTWRWVAGTANEEYRPYVFQFDDAADAVYFKLRWG